METVESKGEPDPTDYSKWCRMQSKGKLEIGIFLLRLSGWINRFLANVRKHQNDRVRGELTPREAEEQIIMKAEQECFPARKTGTQRQQASSQRECFTNKITPKLYGGLLRSNTRLRYSNELPDETKFPIILPKIISLPN